MTSPIQQPDSTSRAPQLTVDLLDGATLPGSAAQHQGTLFNAARIDPAGLLAQLRTTAPGSAPARVIVDARQLTSAELARWAAALRRELDDPQRVPAGLASLGVVADRLPEGTLRELTALDYAIRRRLPPACEETIDHLGAYLAHSLSPKEAGRFTAHIRGCAECHDKLLSLELFLVLMAPPAPGDSAHPAV